MATAEIPEDPRKDRGLDETEKAERVKDKTRLFETVFPLELSPDASSSLSDAKRFKNAKGENTAITECQPGDILEPTSSTRNRSEEEKDKLFDEERAKEKVAREKARQRFKDLQGLQKKLEAKNLRAGKLLGLGSMGVVFELLNNKTGEKIDSAVLRIDPIEINGIIDNPAAAAPLYRDINGYYEASVMIKGKEIDPAMSKADKHALVAETLKIFNATDRGPREEDDREGKLAHITDLDYLKDLNTGQFMKFEGVEHPVLTDISSQSNRPITAQDSIMVGMGTVDDYIETSIAEGYDGAKTRTAKAEPQAVEKMQAQVNALKARVREELAAKGIVLSTPTHMTEPRGTEVAAQMGHEGHGL